MILNKTLLKKIGSFKKLNETPFYKDVDVITTKDINNVNNEQNVDVTNIKRLEDNKKVFRRKLSMSTNMQPELDDNIHTSSHLCFYDAFEKHYIDMIHRFDNDEHVFTSSVEDYIMTQIHSCSFNLNCLVNIMNEVYKVLKMTDLYNNPDLRQYYFIDPYELGDSIKPILHMLNVYIIYSLNFNNTTEDAQSDKTFSEIEHSVEFIKLKTINKPYQTFFVLYSLFNSIEFVTTLITLIIITMINEKSEALNVNESHTSSYLFDEFLKINSSNILLEQQLKQVVKKQPDADVCNKKIILKTIGHILCYSDVNDILHFFIKHKNEIYEKLNSILTALEKNEYESGDIQRYKLILTNILLTPESFVNLVKYHIDNGTYDVIKHHVIINLSEIL